LKKIQLYIFTILSFLPKKRQKQLFLVILLVVFVSLIEVLSLASFYPFISLVLNNNSKPLNILHIYIEKYNFQYNKETLATIFCALILSSLYLRITLTWMSNNLVFNIANDLSCLVYRKSLLQNFNIQINRNSSEIISVILNKLNDVIYNVILSLVNVFSCTIIIIIITTFLLYYEPIIISSILILFSIIYVSISILTKHKLIENSNIVSKQNTLIVKILQESLGGIRDIIFSSSHDYFCRIYNDSDRKLRNAQASNSIIIQIPKYILESLGILTIALLALYLSYDDTGNSIAKIGLIILSVQRLLPLIHQVYVSYSSINGTQDSFTDVTALLNQEISTYNNFNVELPFSKSITLSEISFRYNLNSKYILKNVSLKIQKGDRVGIIGTSGAGKSTLIDIITGLKYPDSGTIYIDNEPINQINSDLWRSKISYVPQSIFLTDQSFLQNIAFGVSENKININLVIEAAKKACIFDYIYSLPHKFDTKVGEIGVKLSGGQKQRLGIARALYKSNELIVFDESTSALDNVTENEIMNSIYNLDEMLTILIVTHRQNILSNCDYIIEINEGKILITR